MHVLAWGTSLCRQVIERVARRKNGRGARQITRAALGSHEWVREMLRQATEDGAYLQANWKRLMAKHPEQWVAIRRQRVVAHADTAESVLSQLAAKSIDPAWTTIELLTDRTRHLIL
jgi:hypothetical protein